MIFTSNDDDFESEKERNLYYKVFAGFLLNEFVPGVDARVAALADLINSCNRRGQAASTGAIRLSSSSTHVSFDNHAYLFGELAPDKGEFADILIHDRASRVVIPIEAKVHSDWSYEKDVVSNERRLAAIEAQMPGAHFVPCLLLAARKWEEVQRHKSHEYSNFRRFVEEPECRTRVLLWEELIPLIDDPVVRSHVMRQLDRPRNRLRYGFSDGWFLAEPAAEMPADA